MSITKTCKHCGQSPPEAIFRGGPTAVRPHPGGFTCEPCSRRSSRERFNSYRDDSYDGPAVGDAKTCGRCGRSSETTFKGGPVVLRRRTRPFLCEACGSRNSRSLSAYGLSDDDVRRLSAETNGLCPLCLSRPWTDVDHDHRTGLFRGLLCHGCNVGIGMLQDDPAVLLRATEYLS